MLHNDLLSAFTMITVDGRNKHFDVDIARRHKRHMFSSPNPKTQMSFPDRNFSISCFCLHFKTFQFDESINSMNSMEDKKIFPLNVVV